MNEEDPAFPGFAIREGESYPSWIGNAVPGLTKREWFAGMVIQGIMSSPEQIVAAVNIRDEKKLHSVTEIIANSAFEYADAMIEASKK